MQDELNPVEIGKEIMRGAINTNGIEAAAALMADQLAEPFGGESHAKIRGAFLAAFEAGMLHQLNRSA